jgi:RHS repeat-associated protein
LLNLPSRVEKTATPEEEFAGFDYTFGGEKIRKAASDGAGTTERLYLGGAEFVDGEAESFYHPEGRVVFDNTIRFQYKLTDHLGNTVVLFEDKNGNGEILESADPELSEVLQRHYYYPFGMQMEGLWNRQTAPGMGYLYNGKEFNEDLGLNWSDYGARWYDASIGRWNGVDPLAGMYVAWSPYNYALNNPIRFIDPNGMNVIAGSHQAQENIRNTLTEEENKYVKFNKKGELKVKRLNKSKSTSGNFTALKALANSETNYVFRVADSYESADSDSPQKLTGDGEGTVGVTLFPDAEIDQSPDDNVYIYTSAKLSPERQAENTAHEGYGHAYFGELQQQGEDVNRNHDYQSVMTLTDPDHPDPLQRYSSVRTDMNIPLKTQIKAREVEAQRNFRARQNLKKNRR